MALVKVKVGVTGNVKKRIAKIVVDAQHMNGGYTAVGWDRNEKYPDGTSVARVALWNEFGTHNSDGSVHSPARPFMRPAYSKNRGAIFATQITVIQQVLAQKITPEKALNILGYRMWQFVRSAILSNTPPPLAARTLAAKRRAGRPAVTLIDTRRMLDTLGYKIYIGGRGRPPMKEEPVQPGGTGGGGGSPTIKPQHQPGATATPRANEHPKPGAVSNIPHVRTPAEIRREKKALQDELRRAKRKKAVAPKNPSPNGGGRGRVRVPQGGKKKAKKEPKQPRSTKASINPAKSPEKGTPRPSSPTGPSRVTTVPGKARRLPKSNTSTTPGAVRPGRQKPRQRKEQDVARVREEKRTRSKTAGKRRQRSAFEHLEESLLRSIIALARGASRYGRTL